MYHLLQFCMFDLALFTNEDLLLFWNSISKKSRTHLKVLDLCGIIATGGVFTLLVYLLSFLTIQAYLWTIILIFSWWIWCTDLFQDHNKEGPISAWFWCALWSNLDYNKQDNHVLHRLGAALLHHNPVHTGFVIPLPKEWLGSSLFNLIFWYSLTIYQVGFEVVFVFCWCHVKIGVWYGFWFGVWRVGFICHCLSFSCLRVNYVAVWSNCCDISKPSDGHPAAYTCRFLF